METSSGLDVDYLLHCQYEKGLSEKTLKAYRIDLSQFIAFLSTAPGAGTCLGAVGKDSIRLYMRELTDRYKPKSVKRKLATIQGLYGFLEQEDIITVSPFRKMKISVRHEIALPRAIPMRSIRRLFRHLYRMKDTSKYPARLLRDIAVLELLFSTGARVSEIAALSIGDVDLKSSTVKIMGKGRRERLLPICDVEVVDALREYASAYDTKIAQSGSFFVNRDGNPISSQSIRAILKRRSQEAGIDVNLTPHMFRHTVATQLVANGADIRNVQFLLGHSSILTTQIYTHVDTRSSRKALSANHPRKRFSPRDDRP